MKRSSKLTGTSYRAAEHVRRSHGINELARLACTTYSNEVGEMCTMDGFFLNIHDRVRGKPIQTTYIQLVDHLSRYRTIRRVTGLTAAEGTRVLSDHI